MIWAVSKLYSYKSGHANDLLFQVIDCGLYSTENMYVEYVIYPSFLLI